MPEAREPGANRQPGEGKGPELKHSTPEAREAACRTWPLGLRPNRCGSDPRTLTLHRLLYLQDPSTLLCDSSIPTPRVQLSTFPGGPALLGEENGNPLQYSRLENPTDRGAWRTTVHGVARVGHDSVTKPPPALLPALTTAGPLPAWVGTHSLASCGTRERQSWSGEPPTAGCPAQGGRGHRGGLMHLAVDSMRGGRGPTHTHQAALVACPACRPPPTGPHPRPQPQPHSSGGPDDCMVCKDKRRASEWSARTPPTMAPGPTGTLTSHWMFLRRRPGRLPGPDSPGPAAGHPSAMRATAPWRK